MSRLTIDTPSRADLVMEQLYKDLERRIESSPPGLCPVDLSRAFLELCHAQTCGKCVPCRVGLGQLNHLAARRRAARALARFARRIQRSTNNAKYGYDIISRITF